MQTKSKLVACQRVKKGQRFGTFGCSYRPKKGFKRANHSSKVEEEIHTILGRCGMLYFDNFFINKNYEKQKSHFRRNTL